MLAQDQGLRLPLPSQFTAGGQTPYQRRLNPDKSGSKNWYAETCIPYGLGDEPRRVIDELSQIRMVDVVLPTRSGVEIRRR